MDFHLVITKTYTAKSLSDAIETIKREMGQRASIVSTKKVKVKKGLFRFTEELLEVTARVDEKYLTREQLDCFTDKERGQVTPDEMPGVKVSISARAKDREPQASLEDRQKIQEEFKKEMALFEGPVESKVEPQSQEKVVVQDKTQVEPEAFNPLEAFSAPVQAVPALSKAVSTHSTDLILREQGVDEALMTLWHDHALGLSADLSADDVFDECVSFFLEQFIPFGARLPKIFSFIGPQGSGKTSTVLKLAQLLKNNGKRVAVFTLDGDHGVVEDMRQKTEDMEIPFCVIYQIRSFNNAIRDYADFDHVLVDTFAVTHTEMTRVDSLQKKLMQMKAPSFVVLSAVEAHNQATMEVYKRFETLGLIFSRIDELNTAGQMFNFLNKCKMRVAYFGIGRDLAEDIEEATAERLVAMLFGME